MQAKRLGLARIVAVSFLLADKLFGTALLVQLGVQGDPVVDALAQRILRRIITDGGFDPESVGYFRLMMDLRERLGTGFLFFGGFGPHLVRENGLRSDCPVRCSRSTGWCGCSGWQCGCFLDLHEPRRPGRLARTGER